MAIKGRASWSLALWQRYIGAGKSAAIVRQRLELARKEARAEWGAELEGAADRKLGQLEGAPAPAAPARSLELAKDARTAGAGSDSGTWWW